MVLCLHFVSWRVHERELKQVSIGKYLNWHPFWFLIANYSANTRFRSRFLCGHLLSHYCTIVIIIAVIFVIIMRMMIVIIIIMININITITLNNFVMIIIVIITVIIMFIITIITL